MDDRSTEGPCPIAQDGLVLHVPRVTFVWKGQEGFQPKHKSWIFWDRERGAPTPWICPTLYFPSTNGPRVRWTLEMGHPF